MGTQKREIIMKDIVFAGVPLWQWTLGMIIIYMAIQLGIVAIVAIYVWLKERWGK